MDDWDERRSPMASISLTAPRPVHGVQQIAIAKEHLATTRIEDGHWPALRRCGGRR